MPDIAVVVVAYRSAATLSACLVPILSEPGTRVAVVDNASDPASRELCTQLALAHPGRLHYDDPGVNLGYSKACNRGIEALEPTELVAVVNPDVALERGLAELASLADFGPSDVIAGRLQSPHGGTSLNARPRMSFSRELGKAILGTRSYRLPELVAPDGRTHVVGQLDGALLLLTAAVWKSLGGFDERFELYYEDVDLCARVNQVGRCLLVNSPWGSHVGGHSFNRSAGRAFLALRVSRTRYALKWWQPAWRARAAVLLVTVAEFVARSLTRRPEGQAVRLASVRAVIAELRRPGSQQVLTNAGNTAEQ